MKLLINFVLNLSFYSIKASHIKWIFPLSFFQGWAWFTWTSRSRWGEGMTVKRQELNPGWLNVTHNISKPSFMNKFWSKKLVLIHYSLWFWTWHHIFVSFLKGPNGEMGQTGPPGERGEKGEMGLSGPAVSSDSKHVSLIYKQWKVDKQLEVHLALCGSGYGRTERRERRLQTRWQPGKCDTVHHINKQLLLIYTCKSKLHDP